MPSKKLLFLESIRGLAAFSVVINHLIGVFYPILNTNGLDTSRGDIMKHGFLARMIAVSPFSIVHNGNLAVQIFFMLSGVVLSLSYFRKKDPAILTSAALRRYFRLMIPALASVLFAWLIIKIHGYYDLQAATLMGRGPDGACPIIADRSFFEAFKLGAYGIFFDPHVDLSINAPLWTMPIELQGSFLIFAFLALIGPLTNRPVIYVVLAALCFFTNRIALFDFLAGVLICDAYIALEKRNFRTAFPLYWGLPALALGILLGGLKEVWVINLIRSYLGHGVHTSNGVHQAITTMPPPPALPLTELGVLSIPAAFFIIASVMLCPALQAAFHAKVFLFLGRISFPLYLFHMPVIHSLGCFTYTRLWALHMTHLSSTLGASFVSIVASVLLAWAAYHAIDLPSIRFGRVFDEWIKSVTMPWHNWTAGGGGKG